MLFVECYPCAQSSSAAKISYSIYLLHPFVLFAMQALFEGLYQVSLAAATSVLVILMSFATYRLIEPASKKMDQRSDSNSRIGWGQSRPVTDLRESPRIARSPQ